MDLEDHDEKEQIEDPMDHRDDPYESVVGLSILIINLIIANGFPYSQKEGGLDEVTQHEGEQKNYALSGEDREIFTCCLDGKDSKDQEFAKCQENKPNVH